MTGRKAINLLFLFAYFLSLSICALGQSQTTGRIVGTVKDERGAVIVGAEVTVTSLATSEERKVTTDAEGNYAVPLLSPGTYHVSVTANGFKKAGIESVRVVITETFRVDVSLEVGTISEQTVINASGPLTQSSGPQLGRVVDSRAVSELPLATRNFL